MSKRDQENSSRTLVEARLEVAFRRNRRWYLVQGILFLVAGVVAMLLPTLTMIAIEIVLAVLLVASGLYQTYQGSMDRSGWLVMSGLLSLVVGVMLLLVPTAGAVALATLIALFLIFEGIVEIILARQLRFSSYWGWLMASGILSVILGSLLLYGWPAQTVFLAGVLLGINFIFYGVAILAIMASARRVGV